MKRAINSKRPGTSATTIRMDDELLRKVRERLRSAVDQTGRQQGTLTAAIHWGLRAWLVKGPADCSE